MGSIEKIDAELSVMRDAWLEATTDEAKAKWMERINKKLDERNEITKQTEVRNDRQD